MAAAEAVRADIQKVAMLTMEKERAKRTGARIAISVETSPPKVELTRQGVRVTVETEVTSIVPFVPHLVRRSAEMPRESYVMEIDR